MDGPYAAATGSHAATGKGTNALLPAALDNGVFDSLDTTTLVTLPGALMVSAPSSGWSQTGRRPVLAGGRARWVFGEQIEISSVSLPWTGAAAGAPSGSTVRVALEKPGGQLVWQHPTVTTSLTGDLEVELPRPSPGIGLVVATPRPGTFGPAVVRTAQGRSYAASGELQDALATAQWTFDGDQGPLAFYSNERARPPLSLRGIAGAGTVGAVGTEPVRASPRSDLGRGVVSPRRGSDPGRGPHSGLVGYLAATGSGRPPEVGRPPVRRCPGCRRSGRTRGTDLGLHRPRVRRRRLVRRGGALVLVGLWLGPAAGDRARRVVVGPVPVPADEGVERAERVANPF